MQIVTPSRKYDLVTPILRQLNWLPVKQLLHLRDLVTAWRCLNNLTSTCLCDKFRKRSTFYSLATRKRDSRGKRDSRERAIPKGVLPYMAYTGISSLNKVWVFTLNRVYKFAPVCTKQDIWRSLNVSLYLKNI